MIRKLTILIGILWGLKAYALGLSHIEVYSKLNEPLKASVKVFSLPKGELGNLRATLASNEAFRRAGIERPYVLTSVNFSVVPTDKDSAVIHISSPQPIKEPFLNFLVEVTWPSGRVLREYTVLLDPPLYESKLPVVTAAAQPMAPRATPNKKSLLSSSRLTPPKSKKPSLKRPMSLSTSGRGRGGAYKVSTSDTLWKIALRTRPRSLSLQQHMASIFSNNREAFIKGNMNLLKSGKVLRIPGLREGEMVAQESPEIPTSTMNQPIEEAPSAREPERMLKPLAEEKGDEGQLKIGALGPDAKVGGERGPVTDSVPPSQENSDKLNTLIAENTTLKKENENLKAKEEEQLAMKRGMEKLEKELKGLKDNQNNSIKKAIEEEVKKVVGIHNREMAELQEQLKKAQEALKKAQEGKSIKPDEQVTQLQKKLEEKTQNEKKLIAEKEKLAKELSEAKQMTSLALNDKKESNEPASSVKKPEPKKEEATEKLIAEEDQPNKEASEDKLKEPQDEGSKEEPKVGEPKEELKSSEPKGEPQIDKIGEPKEELQSGESDQAGQSDQAKLNVEESQEKPKADEPKKEETAIGAKEEPKSESIEEQNIASPSAGQSHTSPIKDVKVKQEEPSPEASSDLINDIVALIPGGWMTIGGIGGGLALLLLVVLLKRQRSDKKGVAVKKGSKIPEWKEKTVLSAEELAAELARLDSETSLGVSSTTGGSQEEGSIEDIDNFLKDIQSGHSMEEGPVDEDIIVEVDVYMGYENYEKA